jgi:hypothetical protein
MNSIEFLSGLIEYSGIFKVDYAEQNAVRLLTY